MKISELKSESEFKKAPDLKLDNSLMEELKNWESRPTQYCDFNV